jgi:hypothetical protein
VTATQSRPGALSLPRAALASPGRRGVLPRHDAETTCRLARTNLAPPLRTSPAVVTNLPPFCLVVFPSFRRSPFPAASAPRSYGGNYPSPLCCVELPQHAPPRLRQQFRPSHIATLAYFGTFPRSIAGDYTDTYVCSDRATHVQSLWSRPLFEPQESGPDQVSRRITAQASSLSLTVRRVQEAQSSRLAPSQSDPSWYRR